MIIGRLLILLILLGGYFSSLGGPSIFIGYRKLSDGVEIELEKKAAGAAGKLRLRVVSDKIIQVIVSPHTENTAGKSLIVVEGTSDAESWKINEKDNGLEIETQSLRVVVNGATGTVSFFDKSGQILLNESSSFQDIFQENNIEKEKSFILKKYFDATEGEAFYGLGQHQTGIMNYRGYQVDLTQYNGVAVVPFVVSSKNYGILWDNYSISKFGDIREYQPLSSFKLYNKEGTEGGLTAIYSSKSETSAVAAIREETEIDYEFLNSLNKLPEGFMLAGNKVVWEGFIESDVTGLHTFSMLSSGYVKVWMDGKLLIDKWREAWNPGPAVFRQELKSGNKHHIKLEWDPDGGQAFVALRYLTPQTQEEASKVAFSSEAGDEVNYYFIHGKNLDEIIGGYRKLTGKAQVMPKWAMGFWQSRERYKTQEELLGTLREFRKRKIGIDNIVLDWSYWEEDAWGSHEFDKDRFPDPEGMIAEVHKNNARIMISVWPKFYEGIENYKAFDEKGLLYKQNILNKERDWIGQGYVSTFYDAYNPQARDLFWQQLNDRLFKKGIDAWWLDATEPDILSNASIEHRKTLMNPTALGPSTKYFNAYSLVNAKGIYEGQRTENPDKRVFILTRSAFAGLQRYGAATWSGDISSRFDEMERQIPAGLNFALSGLPYWTTDIGGFFVENKYDQPDPQGEALEEWRELNARWYQFGTFTPLYRAHGQYPYREVFNIAPESHEAYKSILYYNKLRYRLVPYIYSLTGKVYLDDYTIMRPLIMDFADDQQTKNIGNQFLFGPSILVNPVTEYKATSRELYLPASSGWYNLYTGEYLKGGQHLTADAPYGRIPLFVKEGAIIPYGPEIEHVSQKPADTITLYVYAGKDGYFELYEDEEVNYNYENGNYLLIPVSYNEAKKTITIGQQKGKGFEGMLKARTFNVVYVNKDRAKGLDFNAKPDKVVRYKGNIQKIKL